MIERCEVVWRRPTDEKLVRCQLEADHKEKYGFGCSHRDAADCLACEGRGTTHCEVHGRSDDHGNPPGWAVRIANDQIHRQAFGRPHIFILAEEIVRVQADERARVVHRLRELVGVLNKYDPGGNVTDALTRELDSIERGRPQFEVL